MSYGNLIVIGNHIGNRKDIPKRFNDLFIKDLTVFYEHQDSFFIDLEYLGLKKPNKIFKYDVAIEDETIKNILNILKTGEDVVFVLENGMIGFADPGLKLINACHNNNINVNIIPGPSIISVLPSIAGLLNTGTAWTFEEFFSQDLNDITDKIMNVKDLKHNLIFLNRSNTLTILSIMLEIFNEDRLAAVCINVGLEDQAIVRNNISKLIVDPIVNNIDLELTSIVCSGKLN